MIYDKKLTRARDIEVLILDNCTRKEAIAHLNNGTIVFEADDFENNLEDYLDSWGYNDDPDGAEDKKLYYDMIKNGYTSMDGWSVVTHKGKRYYVEYCL